MYPWSDNVFERLIYKNKDKEIAPRLIMAGFHPASGVENDTYDYGVFLDISEITFDEIPVEITRIIPRLSQEKYEDYIKRVCTQERNLEKIIQVLKERAQNLVGPAEIVLKNSYISIKVEIPRNREELPTVKIIRK